MTEYPSTVLAWSSTVDLQTDFSAFSNFFPAEVENGEIPFVLEQIGAVLRISGFDTRSYFEQVQDYIRAVAVKNDAEAHRVLESLRRGITVEVYGRIRGDLAFRFRGLRRFASREDIARLFLPLVERTMRVGGHDAPVIHKKNRFVAMTPGGELKKEHTQASAEADTPPVDILRRGKKLKEARDQVAKLLGISPDDVEISVRRQYGSLMRDISDLQIAFVVIKNQGNKTKTAQELGVSFDYVVTRFIRAREESPLKEPFLNVRFTRGKKRADDDSSRIGPLDSNQWGSFLRKYGYKGKSAIPDQTIVTRLDRFVGDMRPPTRSELEFFYTSELERFSKNGWKPQPRNWTDAWLIESRKRKRQTPFLYTVENILWELREEDIRITWDEISERASRAMPDSLLAKSYGELVSLLPPIYFGPSDM